MKYKYIGAAYSKFKPGEVYDGKYRAHISYYIVEKLAIKMPHNWEKVTDSRPSSKLAPKSIRAMRKTL